MAYHVTTSINTLRRTCKYYKHIIFSLTRTLNILYPEFFIPKGTFIILATNLWNFNLSLVLCLLENYNSTCSQTIISLSSFFKVFRQNVKHSISNTKYSLILGFELSPKKKTKLIQKPITFMSWRYRRLTNAIMDLDISTKSPKY